MGIILIFGATYAIEYYANSQFSTQELVVSRISGYERGIVQTFDYFKDEEQVGTYVYTLDEYGNNFIMTSLTDVTYGGRDLELESVYTFDYSYSPESYALTVISDGGVTEISTSVSNGIITTSVTSQGVTVDIPDEYVDGMFLIENGMPGFWEVLFNSVEIKHGVKYTAIVYIPQGAKAFDVNLVVGKQDQLIWVGDERLACTVINEVNMELSFYMYEGDLVEMRSESQGIVLQKVLD